MSNYPPRLVIEKTMAATDKAIEMISEGDLVRRQTALEIRDMQLSMHEDYERIQSMLQDSDAQIYAERVRNARWLDQRAEKARASADVALASVLMVSDIQALEKKVDILNDSVVQLNKAFFEFENKTDMQDLMDQVSEMLYRTERKEQEALEGRATDEKSVEKAFRGAVEALYGLRSGNPKIIEEAKQLAGELRVFCDAAANKNFYNMITKTEEEQETVAQVSKSIEKERKISSSGGGTSSSSKKTTTETTSGTTTGTTSGTTSGTTTGNSTSSQMTL